ncbi:MAG: vWA domain-containing protein [Candidatus Nanopelagicales bacterium]
MRRSLAGLAAVCMSVPLMALTPTVHSAGNDQLGDFVESFSQCASGSGSADVLILLDESASLRESDPSNLRAPAAVDFVEQMQEFAADSEADITVQVAGFDGNFKAGEWRELNDTSVAELRADVEQVGRQADGLETDYVNALNGAREQFVGQRSDCQMLVFFTDGEYDVDGSYGPKKYSRESLEGDAADWVQVEKDGKALLCEGKSGPLNSLRKSGVYIVGIGLEKGDAGQLEFLREVASGQGCGTPPEPDRWAFLEATDARNLIFELSRVTAPNDYDGSTDDRGQGSFAFGLDPIITSASVMAQAGNEDLQVKLVNPKGDVVAASSDEGETTKAGVSIRTVNVGPATTRFRLQAQPGRDLAGRWSVRFSPKPGKAGAKGVSTRGTVKVRSDLRPVLVDPQPAWQTGEPVTVTAQVENKTSGQIVPASALPNAEMSLEYRDSVGQITSLVPLTPVSDWAGGLPIAQSLPLGNGRLALTLRVQMQAKPTTRLAPQARSYPLQVKAPPNYPPVAAGLVTLTSPKGGVAEGVDPSAGTITITGPGCVWLDPDKTAVESLPQGLTEEQIRLQSPASTQQTCVSVVEGQTATIEVEAVPDASGYGAYSGTLTLQTQPSDGSYDPLPVTIPFIAERANAVDRPLQIIVLVVGLLLGLGIPAGILFFVRARTARIPVSDPENGDLAYVAKTIGLAGERVEALELTRQDVRLPHDGSTPTVQQLLVEGVELAAVPFGNPFSIAHVKATAPGRTLLSDSDVAASPEAGVKLPLALEGHWLAWREGGSVRVVYFFSTNDLRGNDMAQLSHDLHESLSGRIAMLNGMGEEPVPVAPTGGAAAVPEADAWGTWGSNEPPAAASPPPSDWGQWDSEPQYPNTPGKSDSTPPSEPWDDGWGTNPKNTW